MIIDIYGNQINMKIVEQAVKIMKNGGLIIYPTDTVYGIGCDINNKEALKKMYQIKGMVKEKPVSILCKDMKEVSEYAIISTAAYRHLNRLLPGPYTFILQGRKSVPKLLISKQRTVGIRIPDHDFSRMLAKEMGYPIVSTSVNIGEQSFASDPVEFMEYYDGKVDLILNSGPSYCEPSSVIDFTDETPVLLREGQGDVSWI
jgi:tRNA threonylcarbamoyl adenosine modification protein (Sua5/YciO/YrdC/YwlC family)